MVKEQDVSSPALQANRKPAIAKDTVVVLRTKNNIKLAAMRAARSEHLSVSSLCEKLIVEHLLSAGYVSRDGATLDQASLKHKDED